VTVPMTLSDQERHKPQDTRGQNFPADFHNYAQTTWSTLQWQNLVW